MLKIQTYFTAHITTKQLLLEYELKQRLTSGLSGFDD